jgi:hypothetical protein
MKNKTDSSIGKHEKPVEIGVRKLKVKGKFFDKNNTLVRFLNDDENNLLIFK